MTAMIGLPAGLLLGALLGFGLRQVLITSAIWYAALAGQTAYLAHGDRSAFGGKDGLETVHWWAYWVLQPALLAAMIGLLWLGARINRAVRLRRSHP